MRFYIVVALAGPARSFWFLFNTAVLVLALISSSRRYARGRHLFARCHFHIRFLVSSSVVISTHPLIAHLDHSFLPCISTRGPRRLRSSMFHLHICSMHATTSGRPTPTALRFTLYYRLSAIRAYVLRPEICKYHRSRCIFTHIQWFVWFVKRITGQTRPYKNGYSPSRLIERCVHHLTTFRNGALPPSHHENVPKN